MGFSQSIKTCLSKYVAFSGRAQRSEYWWFVLFVILVSIVLAILDSILFGTNPETGEGSNALNSIFHLAMLLPLIAAGWRRLHDTCRPGWYLLIPFAFSIATMVMVLTGVAAFSVLETNGADPDALSGSATFLGVTGMIVVYVLQFVFAVLMIWWLTRPSQEGSNEFGPKGAIKPKLLIAAVAPNNFRNHLYSPTHASLTLEGNCGRARRT